MAVPFAGIAKDSHDHPDTESVEREAVTDVPPGEARVEINGLVCSFCAVGAEKAVKKLPFLDPARFNAGVHVDINTHQMRLALKPGVPIEFPRLARVIRASGYEALDIYLRVRGRVEERESGMVLVDSGLEYALDKGSGQLSASGELRELLLRIDGRKLHEQPDDAPVKAALIRIYES